MAADAQAASWSNSDDLDVAFDLVGPCDLSSQPATAECDAALRLNTDGSVHLHPGFACDFHVGVACTLSVRAPQIVMPMGAFAFDEPMDTLNLDLDLPARRTGSTACGAATSGIAGFDAAYDTLPTNLTILP